MKANKSISETLKGTFLILEKNSILEKPNKLNGYRIIEIQVDENIIGIGIDKEGTKLAIFMIKTDCHYESYDEKKYKQTFLIGIPENCGSRQYLKLELNPICADNGNFQKISRHMAAVTKIYETLLIFSCAKVLTPLS